MRPVTRAVTRALTYPLVPALLAATLAVDVRHRGPLEPPGAGDLTLVLALVACWAVGLVVTWQVFDQLAGWAFLGLAAALSWSAFTDEYSALGVIEHHDIPVPELVATLSDTSFVWWFVFLALVLQLTRPAAARPARLLPLATLGLGIAFQVLALLRSTELDPPFRDVRSPWAVESLSGPIAFLAAVAVFAVGLCLIASVVVLARTWRHSVGESRRQLLWLVVGAIPLAPAVVAAFALSSADEYDLVGVVLGIAMVTLVVGAALSILRFRLYDVERVVIESAAYAIASVAVVIIFAAVIVVIARTTPIDAGSPTPTIAATLAGVGVARLSYVWGLRAVGRRVDPIRYDAVDRVRAGLTRSV